MGSRLGEFLELRLLISVISALLVIPEVHEQFGFQLKRPNLNHFGSCWSLNIDSELGSVCTHSTDYLKERVKLAFFCSVTLIIHVAIFCFCVIHELISTGH